VKHFSKTSTGRLSSNRLETFEKRNLKIQASFANRFKMKKRKKKNSSPENRTQAFCLLIPQAYLYSTETFPVTYLIWQNIHQVSHMKIYFKIKKLLVTHKQDMPRTSVILHMERINHENIA
jgi:hypothetical protein